MTEPLNPFAAIEQELAFISPDPAKARYCKRPSCGGLRGYDSIAVNVTPDGKRYTINLCCGTIGKSPYALLKYELERMEGRHVAFVNAFLEKVQQSFDTLNATIEEQTLQITNLQREVARVRLRVDAPIHKRLTSNQYLRRKHANQEEQGQEQETAGVPVEAGIVPDDTRGKVEEDQRLAERSGRGPETGS